MESHQKSATEWLQFCWDFVKPRWNSFATFFFLACSSARIFFLCHLCCMQFFSSNKRLQEIFFQNPPPPPPSRVKWSAPLRGIFLPTNNSTRVSNYPLKLKLKSISLHLHARTKQLCTSTYFVNVKTVSNLNSLVS